MSSMAAYAMLLVDGDGLQPAAAVGSTTIGEPSVIQALKTVSPPLSDQVVFGHS